jgi:hypothetical protein
MTTRHRPGLYVSDCTCPECENTRRAINLGHDATNALPRLFRIVWCDSTGICSYRERADDLPTAQRLAIEHTQATGHDCKISVPYTEGISEPGEKPIDSLR